MTSIAICINLQVRMFDRVVKKSIATGTRQKKEQKMSPCNRVMLMIIKTAIKHV